MRRASLTTLFAFALAGLTSTASLAQEEKAATATGSDPSDGAAGSDTHPQEAPRAKPTEAQTQSPEHLPESAAAALFRASAAYEYGDMNQVVESARPVTEGLLPASSYEQVQALRLLGIGLYLTHRPLGAETAFTQLLRKDPTMRLDPTSTRPEVVAFFESLRQQQIARQSSARKVVWNFIPPVGQFQNEDKVKGWIILGVGVASFASLVTSDLLLRSWSHEDKTADPHHDAAVAMRKVNWVSAGVLAAVYVYGVFDGLIGYSKPLQEDNASASLRFFARGGALGFAF